MGIGVQWNKILALREFGGFLQYFLNASPNVEYFQLLHRELNWSFIVKALLMIQHHAIFRTKGEE